MPLFIKCKYFCILGLLLMIPFALFLSMHFMLGKRAKKIDSTTPSTTLSTSSTSVSKTTLNIRYFESACEFFEPLGNYSFERFHVAKNRSLLNVSMKDSQNETIGVQWSAKGELHYEKDEMKMIFVRKLMNLEQKNEICECLKNLTMGKDVNQFLKDEKDAICWDCFATCEEELNEDWKQMRDPDETVNDFEYCQWNCRNFPGEKFLHFGNTLRKIKKNQKVEFNFDDFTAKN